LKTNFGEAGIKVPWNRKGEFDLDLAKKKQTSLSGGIEVNIVSMYSKGLSM
jgi:transposase-like protein